MKSLIILLACSLFSPSIPGQSNVPEPGSNLFVVAPSGLKLRMKPDQHSPSIRVLNYADVVTVVDNNGHQRPDRIQWTDGHWVKVRQGGVSGYVFDGFLSALSPFTHENQLCISCTSIVEPLDMYLEALYPLDCIEESMDDTEELLRTVFYHNGDIQRIKTDGDGWYQMEYVFEGYRLSEILNHARSVMVGKQDKSDFEQSLTFFENKRGKVNRVDSDFFANPMSIEYLPDGIVILKTLVFDPSESLTGQ